MYGVPDTTSSRAAFRLPPPTTRIVGFPKRLGTNVTPE